MPSTPLTATVRGLPASTAWPAHGVLYASPLLVSQTRVGDTAGVNTPPVAGCTEPSVNHPETSTRTSGPSVDVAISTAPSAPTGTITRFATVCPGPKFTLEVVGADVPEA